MNPTIKSKLNYLSLWLPVLGCGGLIFYLSAQPQLPPPPWELPFIDKFEHLTAYGVLAILLYRALYNSWPDFFYLDFLVLILVVLYGISDEMHQSFVPPRTPEVWDVVFDGLGGLLATQLPWLKNLATRRAGERFSFLIIG